MLILWHCSVDALFCKHPSKACILNRRRNNLIRVRATRRPARTRNLFRADGPLPLRARSETLASTGNKLVTKKSLPIIL